MNAANQAILPKRVDIATTNNPCIDYTFTKNGNKWPVKILIENGHVLLFR